MRKTIVVAAAAFLAGAGACLAQPAGVTRDMISRALPLEGRCAEEKRSLDRTKSRRNPRSARLAFTFIARRRWTRIPRRTPCP